MIYNVDEYITGWRFNGLHDGKRNGELSQTVFVWLSNNTFKRTDTHTHTHTYTHTHTLHTHTRTHTTTKAIGEIATRFISLRTNLD